MLVAKQSGMGYLIRVQQVGLNKRAQPHGVLKLSGMLRLLGEQGFELLVKYFPDNLMAL